MEGVKFYHDVWKKWKTISSGNKFGVWRQLEEGWDEFAEENKLGCVVYSCAKRDSLNDSCNRTTCDNQERGLPGNCFSLDGEEHFEKVKWKKKRSLLHSSDDEDNKNCSTHKKARRSRSDPQFSKDSITSLSQDSSSDLYSEDDKIQESHDNNYEEYNFVGVYHVVSFLRFTECMHAKMQLCAKLLSSHGAQDITKVMGY